MVKNTKTVPVSKLNQLLKELKQRQKDVKAAGKAVSQHIARDARAGLNTAILTDHVSKLDHLEGQTDAYYSCCCDIEDLITSAE